MIQAIFKRGSLQILLITLISFLLASCAIFDNKNDPKSTYTIGGTVSGLSGSLVLQNNGGGNLTRTANGVFTFNNGLTDGAAYSVTVSSQPAGQTCTVTNGSGTVNAAAVTNVQVACTDNPAYSVGGSVSGLIGSLVLQNNGGDNLTRTADGVFTFNTAVNDGAAYSVTVSSQPVGQTCTVTNSAGTINAAAITNVQITCVTNTYTVGGSVSGLIGSLVLQNNGGDNLTRTANGDFTFATELVNGAGYNVTVSSQPAGQTCTVTNGLGIINAAAVTNVQVACANIPTYTVGGSVSGLTDTLVLQNNGGDDLSIAADGTFAFATELANGAGYSVTVSSQPAGQTCTVTDGSGTISSADVTNVQVACAAVTATGWSHPQSFSDGIVTVGGFAQLFQVAMANNGEAVISYVDEIDEGTEGVWEHVFLSEKRGGTWSHPQNLNEKIDLDRDVSGNGGLVLYSGLKPQVAMADNGDTVITWNQENQFGLDSIYMGEILPNGVMVLPENFDDRLNVGNFQSNNATPQVAMAGNGDTIIVWDQTSSSANRSFRKERRGGTWTVPTVSDYFTPADSSSIPVDSTLPHVAIADSGDTVITWQQRISFSRSNERQVLRSNFFDGGPWDDPASYQDYINPTEPDSSSIERGYAIAPRVAISSNGDAIIVWRQNVIFDTSVPASPQRLYLFMSEYDGNTNLWTDPQSLDEFINLDTGYHAQDYQVAMDNNGNAIIVWEQADASYSHIYMLQKSGGSWAANPVDISPQNGPRPRAPQIAMAGNGDAVIIWQQDDNSDPSLAYNQLFMSEYRNGTWTHPADLGDYISLPGAIAGDVGTREDEPHLAMDDNGNTLIVWQQYDPSNNDEERLFISEFRSDTITHNGTTYGTVTSPITGRVWLDRNLGASRVCTAFDDSECFGEYYQWGRDADGHELAGAGTTTTPSQTIDNVGPDFIVEVSNDWTASGVDNGGTLRSPVWSRTDGTSVCPTGFRVPTYAELEAEIPASPNNTSIGVFESDLKLPTTGARYYTNTYPGVVRFQGTSGFVWTSTPGFQSIWGAGVLTIGNSYALMHPAYARAYGMPVRCIKD